jgi:cytochrome c biogenesis protein CcmG/thiol:disulfide interchange protein DsbE
LCRLIYDRRVSKLLWASVGAIVALGVVLGIGLRQADRPQSVNTMPLSEQLRSVRGAPGRLARLHAAAGDLIPGGSVELQRQLASLRGFPVVVNIWASWCPPCRTEAPVFQHVSSELGRRVAFLGVNSADSDDGARALLKRLPVGYPSVTDPSEREADHLRLLGLPATVFFDRHGRQVALHQGQFHSVAELRAQVEQLL